MRCYAFVLAFMYRYAWLIIFEIFRNFFFLDRGVGGWGVSYPNFFWIFIFFLYLQGPLNTCTGRVTNEKLRKMMSGTDWEEQLEGKTVEQAWTTVRSQIDAAVASCIPKKTTRPGDARSRKPWNTSVTIGKVKIKNNMYRRWRNSRDNEDYLSYARARNQARSACRKAVRLYEKDIARQIKQNPKHF